MNGAWSDAKNVTGIWFASFIILGYAGKMQQKAFQSVTKSFFQFSKS